MLRRERMELFVRGIWQWYATHKRVLPWRDLPDDDPEKKAYLVLVSESMLQQTQVARVIQLYKNFVRTFPHIQDLANATNAQILVAWRGLGYNSRALRLRDAARAIVSRGSFPRDLPTLRALPGIGPYTAAALRNFAFALPTPCIDVNIERILHRFFYGIEHADGSLRVSHRALYALASDVLSLALRYGTTADWHAALMDFGALVCTKSQPKWERFNADLRMSCKAYGKQILRTKKVNKKEPGREIAGRFVPDRLIRGKIVEALRDHGAGLSHALLGPIVAIDWQPREHRPWIASILDALVRDGLIVRRGERYRLGGEGRKGR